MDKNANPRLKQVREKVQLLTQRIESFKSSDEFLELVRAMSRFHRYSFKNRMLILAQMPAATRVAGFHTWRQVGRFVKRGEKGLLVWVPLKKGMPRKKEETPEDTEQDLVSVVVGYTTGYVFDISQTDGDPLPELDLSVKNHGWTFMAQCLMLAEKMGVKVMARDSMVADGISRGGKVILRRNDNPTYMTATLLHELAHEKLHHSPDNKQLSREQQELEAETVAYLVCSHFGIEIPAHKYLASWQREGNLMDSLKRISECSTAMIDDLSEIERDLHVNPALVTEGTLATGLIPH